MNALDLALESGAEKLEGVVSLANLPKNRNANAWTKIVNDCHLTLDELSALQNVVCSTGHEYSLLLSDVLYHDDYPSQTPVLFCLDLPSDLKRWFDLPEQVNLLYFSTKGVVSLQEVEDQCLRVGCGTETSNDTATPCWLKSNISRFVTNYLSVSPTPELSLPLPEAFYNVMRELATSKGDASNTLIRYCNGFIRPDHALVLGASQCEKTALTLALAEKNFLIFLEVPEPPSAGSVIKGPTWGYQMHVLDWHRGFPDERAIYAALNAEVATRLLVLLHLLEEHPDLTPTQWLLFCLSDQGSARILSARNHVCDLFPLGNGSLFTFLVDTFHLKLKRLPTVESRYRGHLPLILVVDALQELRDSWTPPPNDARNAGCVRPNAMEAVRLAAHSLCFPAVWSGNSEIAYIAKKYVVGASQWKRGVVGLAVVCDFTRSPSSEESTQKGQQA